MNIKLKISGFLAWLFGWEEEESYTVDISPASKRQGDLMRKIGPCTEEKQKEEFERYSGGKMFNTDMRDKLERMIAENKIRNDTARSIRGIK